MSQKRFIDPLRHAGSLFEPWVPTRAKVSHSDVPSDSGINLHVTITQFGNLSLLSVIYRYVSLAQVNATSQFEGRIKLLPISAEVMAFKRALVSDFIKCRGNNTRTYVS